MSSITFSGVTLSVWKLYDLQTPWQTLRNDITSRAKQVALAEERKNEADANNAKFDLTYRPARTELDAKLGPFINHLTGLQPQLAAAMKNEGPIEQLEQITIERNGLINKDADLEIPIDNILKLGEN